MALVAERALRKWHAEATDYIKQIPGCEDIFEDESRIANADESGYPLNAQTGGLEKILGAKYVQKGQREVRSRSLSWQQSLAMVGFYLLL